jgi:hypothetical protein
MLLGDDGKCEYCDEHTSKRARLAKQREVVQFIDYEVAPEWPYTSVDRVPPGLKDCGDKERPDVLWDTVADRIVILEVDENQHKERPCDCEQTRMVNISQALGAPHTIWIRYNPDAFVGASRSYTQTRRLAILKEWVVWCLSTTTPMEYTIGVVHLFFDGFREDTTRIVKLL